MKDKVKQAQRTPRLLVHHKKKKPNQAVDKWVGINREWSRMIPTNAYGEHNPPNGEDMRGGTHGPFTRH